MKNGVFITGTDTGIGKTLCASVLVAGLRSQLTRAGYWKPVQTGRDDDSSEVERLTAGARYGSSGPVSFGPVLRFRAPAAPVRAARAEGKTIDASSLLATWRRLPVGTWIVEGVGGLLVPISRGFSVLDLARQLGLPLVLVASSRLGAINSILLTLQVAKSSGVLVNGVVLSGDDDLELETFLEETYGIATLARVPNLPQVDAEAVGNLGDAWARSGVMRAVLQGTGPG